MAKQLRVKRHDMKKIHEFLRLLKQEGLKISRVILFGSYARGSAHFDSDIDIVIVSTQFGKNIAEEMMFLRKLALKIDSHIEPVPLSPGDLNDRYSTFIQEIKRYGKNLN